MAINGKKIKTLGKHFRRGKLKRHKKKKRYNYKKRTKKDFSRTLFIIIDFTYFFWHLYISIDSKNFLFISNLQNNEFKIDEC